MQQGQGLVESSLNLLFLLFLSTLFAIKLGLASSDSTAEQARWAVFSLGVLCSYDVVISMGWVLSSFLSLRKLTKDVIVASRLAAATTTAAAAQDFMTASGGSNETNSHNYDDPGPLSGGAGGTSSSSTPLYHFKTPLVIDVGEVYSRLGFSGDELANCVISSQFGGGSIASSKMRMTVGEMSKAAAAASAAVSGKQYMKNGEISDWEGLEKVWKSLYQLEAASDAALDPSEHPVLLSWSPSFSSKDAEKAAEILFENDSFRIPAISFGLSPVLALYASGRTTGCSVHSGESYTHTVAVLEGFALSGSLMRTSVAGKAVTDNFANLIASRLAALGSNGGPNSRFDPYAAHSADYLRLEKTKYCLCAPTRQALRPLSSSSSSSSSSSAGDEDRLLYTGLGGDDEHVHQSTPLLLPDGTVISLNVQSDEQSACAEVLFRSTVKSAFTQEPSLSIQASIEKCIASVETNSQAALWANVVVSGGNTNIRGFSERLHNELGAMGRDGWLESNTPVHIFDTDEVLADRADAPWLGGSVLASSDSFRGWVTRQEYKEHGPALIHTRCQTAM